MENEAAAAKPLKRAAFALVSVALVAMTVLPSLEVLRAVLAPQVVPTDLTCRAGTLALLSATDRARRQAQVDPTRSERRALDEFRAALEPEWRHEEAIRQKCRADRDSIALEALRTIVFLRYAEERSVRAESLDLARLRARLPQLVDRLAQ